MQVIVDNWRQTPPVTRSIFLVTLALSLGVTLEVFTPLKLYFNWKLIWNKGEYWRLISCLFFKGGLTPHTIFDFYICFRYMYSLETSAFRGKPADFITFVFLGCSFFLIAAFTLGLQNMSGAISAMMLYFWARKNPNIEMSFLDIFHFRSCFLPYFLFLMIMLSGYDTMLDLLGMVAGHTYYFCEEVVPRIPQTRSLRLLKAPAWLTAICQFFRLHQFAAADGQAAAGGGGGGGGFFGGGGFWGEDDPRAEELEQ
eukprot:CAMPEP_0170462500 /NCGR_PEP_ID=MMETSP0123-20130129/7981_1 /TAXON_ID=182087 /ORGANISM="Favella ehrenbergii, Strain Fehren 1" /LENGTH=254 /DNA_ID=CAMNT_0010727733 /DNA_START=11 /DNA_END=775 /DNA_ORIENTATION=+